MAEVKAGVIIKSRFVTSSSNYGKTKGYGGFVDYMDRADATTYDKFTNYMSNNEKSDGLFLANTNNPAPEKIAELKEVFKEAQAKGSPLEQIVISFDMNYLKEYNVIENGKINGDLLKDYTRLAIQELQKKEGNMNNFMWAGAIHYNTDHVHIHVGMVDTAPSWTVGEGRCFEYNGKPAQRGKFKLSSLNKAKSVYVNNIINAKEKNKAISNVMQECITQATQTELSLLQLTKYRKMMKELIDHLPENKSLWKYNMNALAEARPYIDNITEWLLENHFKSEIKELELMLDELDHEYVKSYGSADYVAGTFKQNQMNDLYSRIGNNILKEALAMQESEFKFSSSDRYTGKVRLTPLSDLFFSFKKLKKATRKNVSSIKNQAIYERNRRLQEYEKERE